MKVIILYLNLKKFYFITKSQNFLISQIYFEIIKTYSILPDKDTDTLLESTVNQLDLLSHRFGKACGYEFIAKDEINDSLVDFKYMIKCEFYPLIWKFRFYRAKEHWVLNHYEWSDQL